MSRAKSPIELVTCIDEVRWKPRHDLSFYLLRHTPFRLGNTADRGLKPSNQPNFDPRPELRHCHSLVMCIPLSNRRFLQERPMSSSIPGSGGLRKLRWRSRHGGKRGGLQVICFNRLPRGQVLLVTIFSKRRLENFSNKELLQFRKAFDHDD